MSGEDIHISDFARIFIGNIPGIFYLEVVFRAIFIYFVLVVSLRAMGARMAATLTRIELVSIVSLAAAVGMPLLTPERGLLPALIIAIVVVVIGRSIAYMTFKSPKLASLAEDKMAVLVEDTALKLDIMEETRITREFLFAQLRSRGIMHLGEVKRFYIEANGAFTLIREPQTKPGLSILPEVDTDFIKEQEVSDKVWVCGHCGYLQHDATLQSACQKCGKFTWVKSMEPQQ